MCPPLSLFVNHEFETTTALAGHYAEQVKTILLRRLNGTTAVRNVVVLVIVDTSLYVNPLRIALDIRPSFPVGIDEHHIAVHHIGMISKKKHA